MNVSPLGLTTANYPDFSAGMDSDTENTMLYAELRDFMRKTVTQSDENQQRALRRLANLNSALNQYQRFVGIGDKNRVGQELTSRFASQLTRFLNSLAEEGKQRQSIRDRKSQLHTWRAAFIEARLAASDPSGQRSRLASVLLNLFEERGFSAPHIAKQLAIPYSTLKRWLAGDAPNKRSVTSLVRMERFLGLDEGSLSKLVTWSSGARRLRRTPDKGATIAYRQRLGTLSQTPYALKSPAPKLVAQWAELLKYKTDPYPQLARQKRGLWVLRPTSDVSPEQVSEYSLARGVMVAPTAYIAWVKASQFIGFLQLAVDKGGMGLLAEQCHSLGVFANADYVLGYMNFKTNRSEGIQHGGITSFLQFAKSMIHPKTGFVTQHPMFAHEAGLSAEQWHSKCAHAFSVIKELHHTAHSNHQLSRNPWEPIQTLVALRNPLAPIFEATRKLQEEVNRQESGMTRAVLVRNLFLLQLLVANPLRARNLKTMKYMPDNSGNLYQASNGSWRIRFVPHAFKNFQGAAKDRPYDMEVDSSVWPAIEEWLFESRPILECVTTQFVFISSKKSGQGKPWKTLNREVAAITRRYVDNCPGIGPHAFRHLVATTWLKTNPRDYLTVAVLLHDKLETVIANYSHLTVDDGFHQWRQFLSACSGEDGSAGYSNAIVKA